MSTTMSAIHGLRAGESLHLSSDGSSSLARITGKPASRTAVTVHYQSEPSYGDDRRVVPGAFTGRYIVQDAAGRTLARHEHGPHATTDRAAKMGADRSAKGWAADKAYQTALTHLQGFGDRRMAFDQKREGGPRISSFRGE